MSFFKKFFGRRAGTAPKQPLSNSEEKPALILLFNQLPVLDADRLANNISLIEPLHQPAQVAVSTGRSAGLSAMVTFDAHRLRLSGVSSPVPSSAVQYTLHGAGWRQDLHQQLYEHQAHVLCFYEGQDPDPGERLIALYKLAAGFVTQGLLGVLDQDAWNYMPRHFIKEQVNRDILRECRQAVPLGLWTGFVKFFRPDGRVWFYSKGHHRFGVPDFAFLGGAEQADEAFGLFETMFSQVYQHGATLRVGTIAQAGPDLFVQFSAVREYHEQLAGPGTTLVMEKLRPR